MLAIQVCAVSQRHQHIVLERPVQDCLFPLRPFAHLQPCALWRPRSLGFALRNKYAIHLSISPKISHCQDSKTPCKLRPLLTFRRRNKIWISAPALFLDSTARSQSIMFDIHNVKVHPEVSSASLPGTLAASYLIHTLRSPLCHILKRVPQVWGLLE